ncbi:hypothetical protein FE784_26925 [Paenibacillus hemerocallicola]|uniref:Uncharacterized protein n=1 Tax=Paenibacillus hemerocallicola TaxID=1172614 RepID=A0A5C4T4S4_9BACL|nr:glycosylhydrolase-like jelly roll fold domain-containing protein [Paenibacillus hemerocallicola]TNJ63169.1 hypothetical protein FE784_26925 [Paenibacillus hemerocallicola]
MGEREVEQTLERTIDRTAGQEKIQTIDRTFERQFITPSDEYTPIPFWFWNDALDEVELLGQIGSFAEKGVMGFVIHPRMGIPEEIPYLSDRFMDLVEAAVREASRRGMTVFLYDEAMYPSGSANGLVVEGNPEFASRGLKMAEFDCNEPVLLASALERGDTLVSAQAIRKTGEKAADPDSAVVVQPAGGAVSFEPPDSGRWSIVLFIETNSRGTIRGIHAGEDDGQPDAPAAADLLNPAATAKFIRITHERYYGRLARYFGNTVQAFFTDEPDMLGRRHKKGLVPWTGSFLDLFLEEGLRETDLPLLWLEAETSGDVRAKYRRAVRKRLSFAYYEPLADWCTRHGIAFTGHPAASDDIGLQDHFHIPGQDVVWRWVGPEDGLALEGRHSTMAKCSSDAARHRGRRRNLNEVLGVCGKGNGWALTADDMKWYLDWLFVRGVNMLVPHAFYYSVGGPLRYKERPPDVGPNNIWWPHYKPFVDYMKRMCWLMTDSRNVTPVAVLCREDWLPWKIVKPLYEHQIEFNYLEERLLSGIADIRNGAIRIAGQTYTVLAVENGGVWEQETYEAVNRFRDSGGTVIVLDEAGEASRLLPFTRHIAEAEHIVAALDESTPRVVRMHPPSADIRASLLVKEGQHVLVLVNEGEGGYEGRVTVPVSGRVELWNAWSGEIHPADTRRAEAGSDIGVVLERRQSVVYRIDPDGVGQAGEDDAGPAPAASGRELLLTEGWRAEAPDFPGDVAGLGSWTERPGLEHISGTAVYRCSFGLDEPGAGKRLLLNLGEVHEIAEVRVNGQAAGVAMWAPYVIDIRPYVRQGANELAVAVTNSLANRLDGESLPSGLIGPITITVANS